MKCIIALLLLPTIVCAVESASPKEKRGEYFHKKTYTPRELPTFEQSRALLPEPVLDNRADLIDLYWGAWRIGFTHLHRPPENSPLVSNYMDAAFSTHIFQWDTIFMVPFAGYANHVFPVIQSLDNFYSRQRADGYIDREIDAITGDDFVYKNVNNTINPPLFAWAEVKNAHLTGDTSRYSEVYRPLVKYAQYLETARHSLNTVHQLYWNTGLGAGMDNTPRSGSGWVDMSAQMVLMYQSLAEIATTIDKQSDARKFRAHAADIAVRMQKYMWDEEDGLFYDVDDSGQFVKHKTLACFWPMLAKIATDRQVVRLMQHLTNTETFWRKNAWPSLAADEPEYSSQGHYWQGGVWAPTNAMVIGGLDMFPQISGTSELAKAASEKYLATVGKVFRRTGTIWEFYKPDSSHPGVIAFFVKARKDFVGWSGLGPIQFLIEDILGFKVDALKRTITWTVQNNSHHGIRNLHLGSSVVSIEAEARQNASAPLKVKTILMNADRRVYTLDIVLNGRHIVRKLRGGEQEFAIAQ